jgi:hypothetical protein
MSDLPTFHLHKAWPTPTGNAPIEIETHLADAANKDDGWAYYVEIRFNDTGNFVAIGGGFDAKLTRAEAEKELLYKTIERLARALADERALAARRQGA